MDQEETKDEVRETLQHSNCWQHLSETEQEELIDYVYKNHFEDVVRELILGVTCEI